MTYLTAQTLIEAMLSIFIVIPEKNSYVIIKTGKEENKMYGE